ncbi:50S ribosomal protein L30 [candidate division WOR-3 bacterium]|nr:50S ribosomal protein L30 [candidate division WOR-3 bacterium]MCK4575231.1 50S ribosomal protein L30 [candidate division WOR-3 bacterium]
MAKKLRITQIGSAIGRQFDQKGTLKALGIRKLNSTVVKDDTPQIRGMIRKIRHLLVVEEIEEEKITSPVKKQEKVTTAKKGKSQKSKGKNVKETVKKKDKGKSNETK